MTLKILQDGGEIFEEPGSANAILHWIWLWLVSKRSLTSTRDEERIYEGHRTNRLRAQLGNAHSLPHTTGQHDHILTPQDRTGQSHHHQRLFTPQVDLHLHSRGGKWFPLRLNLNLCTLYCIESYQVFTHASLRSGFHHLNALLTILPSWRWRVFGKWEWSKVIRWGAPTLFHLTIVTPSTLIT